MRLFLLSVSALFIGMQTRLSADERQRIVSVGGTVSEIVCALGACDDLVAVDSSSLFPERLKTLPRVGYSRALSVEGILSHRPDLLLISEEAGPAAALEQLKLFKGKQVSIQNHATVTAARQRIRDIGAVLGKAEESARLVAQLDKDLQAVAPSRPGQPRPRVLFVYARGSKVLMIAGRETSAAAMIEVAGGERVGGDFVGYKPLNPESIAAAAPDVVLLTQTGAESIGGEHEVWSLPGFALTPAFRQKSVVVMEDLFLLGMGPRMGLAAQELARRLEGKDSPRIPSKGKR